MPAKPLRATHRMRGGGRRCPAHAQAAERAANGTRLVDMRKSTINRPRPVMNTRGVGAMQATAMIGARKPRARGNKAQSLRSLRGVIGLTRRSSATAGGELCFHFILHN